MIQLLKLVKFTSTDFQYLKYLYSKFMWGNKVGGSVTKRTEDTLFFNNLAVFKTFFDKIWYGKGEFKYFPEPIKKRRVRTFLLSIMSLLFGYTIEYQEYRVKKILVGTNGTKDCVVEKPEWVDRRFRYAYIIFGQDIEYYQYRYKLLFLQFAFVREMFLKKGIIFTLEGVWLFFKKYIPSYFKVIKFQIKHLYKLSRYYLLSLTIPKRPGLREPGSESVLFKTNTPMWTHEARDYVRKKKGMNMYLYFFRVVAVLIFYYHLYWNYYSTRDQFKVIKNKVLDYMVYLDWPFWEIHAHTNYKIISVVHDLHVNYSFAIAIWFFGLCVLFIHLGVYRFFYLYALPNVIVLVTMLEYYHSEEAGGNFGVYFVLILRWSYGFIYYWYVGEYGDFKYHEGWDHNIGTYEDDYDLYFNNLKILRACGGYSNFDHGNTLPVWKGEERYGRVLHPDSFPYFKENEKINSFRLRDYIKKWTDL